MRSALVATLMLLILISSSVDVRAQRGFWTIGPKVGIDLDDGGWIFGFEVSYFAKWMQFDPSPPRTTAPRKCPGKG